MSEEQQKAGPSKGDYVIATKWSDGDPGDHWFVGFYDRQEGDRHYIVDGDGNQGRGNGFRKVAHITKDEGSWLLSNAKEWEASLRVKSVWDYLNERRHAEELDRLRAENVELKKENLEYHWDRLRAFSAALGSVSSSHETLEGVIDELKGKAFKELQRAERAEAALRGGVVVPEEKLLAIRDALLSGNDDLHAALLNAYHELYTAVAWKDPFKPWAEWEAAIAAAKDKQ